MSVDAVLSKLEQDEREERFALDAPITTPPPLYSSFYWKNHFGQKYKVFIPTKEGIVYWNFEEYDFDDMDFNTKDENWREAKKCVQIAVPNTFEDINEVMDKLLKGLSEKRTNDISKPKETKDKKDLKYYRLFKYYVKDILDVDMKYRYEHAKSNVEVKVSPYDEDDQKLMTAINSAFEMIAKHFRKNERRQVYSY